MATLLYDLENDIVVDTRIVQASAGLRKNTFRHWAVSTVGIRSRYYSTADIPLSGLFASGFNPPPFKARLLINSLSDKQITYEMWVKDMVKQDFLTMMTVTNMIASMVGGKLTEWRTKSERGTRTNMATA